MKRFHGPYTLGQVEGVAGTATLARLAPVPSRVMPGRRILATVGYAWRCGCDLRGSSLAACGDHGILLHERPECEVPTAAASELFLIAAVAAAMRGADVLVANEAYWSTR